MVSRCSRLLGCLLVFILIVSAAMAVFAQSAQSTPTQAQTPSSNAGNEPEIPANESATVLKTVTRLVVVDVVATGKNGAVVDLKRDDFSLFEDGKEQKLRVFNFQQPAQNTNGVLVAPKLPENVSTNISRYNAGSALNILLLDSMNTELPNQAFVRDQMVKYLERMPQGQPLAIYTLGNKLTLLQDFTNDPAQLKAVVEKLKSKTPLLVDTPAGTANEDLVNRLPSLGFNQEKIQTFALEQLQEFDQERVAFQTDLRITYTLNALNTIARMLSGFPGRKNLIWVSDAFPLSINPNLQLTNIFIGTRTYGPQIAQTADALINAQVAVYPIDARGLLPTAGMSADNSGRGQSNDGFRVGLGGISHHEPVETSNVHEAMEEMADRTGGIAFYNTNGIDGAVQKSIEDGSVYYTLAYYPDDKTWNGKFRKIQVKVKRPGVKLRYRLGYFAVDPRTFTDQNEKQQDAAFDAALSPITPISTGLPFSVQVVPPQAKAPQTVLVSYGIDPHSISFEKQADGLQHASVECVIQAFSEKGEPKGSKRLVTNAALKPEVYAKVMEAAFPCQPSIDLAPGIYFLRLGVRDKRTGLIGTTNAKVTVAATAGGPEKKP